MNGVLVTIIHKNRILEYRVTYPPIQSYILLHSDRNILHSASRVTTDSIAGVVVICPVRVISAFDKIPAKRDRRR